MGWRYNFWRKNFYSINSKPENFLEEYSKYFDTVEVNSSFYRIPSVTTLEKWKKQTPKNFLFSIKAPKKITHDRTFQINSNYIDYFLTSINKLNKKLGPILFQFPPNFKIDKIGFLKNLISVLPKKQRYAFEVRNKSWLKEPFYKLLIENNIALVLGDSKWLENIIKITSNFIYFRWEGNRKQIKGTTGNIEKKKSDEIEKWGKKINQLLEKTEVFGYFSKYYSGHPPTDAKQILTFLQKAKFKEKSQF
jgi:uncharacterized protein YecE (DUF72 family)